jgi:uroporphyrinogen-III synthase
VAYETQAEPREKAEPFLAALRDGDPIDAIALASPSAFVNFLSMTAPEGELAIRRRAIWLFSIGPTTSRVIRERQLAVTREASPHTSRGLIDTILRFFAPPREAAEETTGGTEAPPSEAADEGPPT